MDWRALQVDRPRHKESRCSKSPAPFHSYDRSLATIAVSDAEGIALGGRRLLVLGDNVLVHSLWFSLH